MYKLARSRACANALGAAKVSMHWTSFEPEQVPRLTVKAELTVSSAELRFSAKAFPVDPRISIGRSFENRQLPLPFPGYPLAYHGQYGVGVPKGEVARSAAEAEKIAKEIGMPYTQERRK